jgi:crossover junction endodeoxyribonuclease RusA
MNQTPSNSFFVSGTPGTAGSKKFVGMSKAGRGIIIDSSGKKGKDWRNLVASTAQEAFHGREPFAGPLSLTVKFVMPRRKGDLRPDGTPRPSAPVFHTTKPDATKMLRAVEDAITGIGWKDDAQIACQIVSKIYGEKPGALITINLI